MPLLLHRLSPTAMSFAGGSCGWAPGCGTFTPTSSSPHNRNHARTHTHTHLPGHNHRNRTLHGALFPVPTARGPHCGPFSSAGAGRGEGGLVGEAPPFLNLVREPGVSNPHSHGQRALLGFHQLRKPGPRPETGTPEWRKRQELRNLETHAERETGA